jgi:hypothetical protein
VARKHPHVGGWTAAEEAEFRKVRFFGILSKILFQMRTLDHTNLNKFLGVAILGNVAYLLWDYCVRGSIMVNFSFIL